MESGAMLGGTLHQARTKGSEVVLMYYQMTVQVARVSAKGWRSSAGLPTFYLRDDMQMFTSAEGACHVARGIVASCLPESDSSLESVDITAASEDGKYATVTYTATELR
jgi:hypothetical protein